jgi:hypothetical protein
VTLVRRRGQGVMAAYVAEGIVAAL